jgi:gliding motility-associated-like protein
MNFTLLRHTAYFLCFFLIQTISSRAQNTNPCGVIAGIDPAGDSIVTSPTVVFFHDASINATSYKFLFDQYEMPPNTPINWSIQPGLTTIRLVAYNGNCTDTTVVHYFYAGQYPNANDNPRRLYGYANRDQHINELTSLSTGGYILSGYRSASSFFNEQQQGMIIKTKQEGCVDWSRKLVGYDAVIWTAKEANDGGIFLLGETNGKRFVTKLDATGNLTWAKSLEQPGLSSLFNYGLFALSDGGALVAASYPNVMKPVILRLDPNGNIIWQREYDYNFSYVSYFNQAIEKNGYLYVGGTLGYNSYANYDAFLNKIDLSSGQTIWTKKYTSPNGTLYMGELISVDSTIVVNITAATNIPNVPVIGGFMRIDTAGQVLSATLIAENYVPNSLVGPYLVGGTRFTRSGKDFYLLSAGSVMLSLQPGISYLTKFIRIDSNFQVPWVRATGGAGVPRFYRVAPAPADGFATGGEETGSALSPNGLGTLLSVKLIDSSGGNPNAGCYFYNQDFLSLPLTVTPEAMQWISDLPSGYVSVDRDFPIYPFYPEMRFKCPDYVDSCSYLKLDGPRSVCNLSQHYTFKSTKNRACGQPTIWTIPPGAQVVLQTDTAVTVRFTAFGRYVIYGTNPLSCIPVQDSIVIIAESKTPPLDLGPDQQICPQNTTTLHAGPQFLTYTWQDGTTDSLYSVNQPGQYWVQVTDSCNNMLTDTIIVSLAPPIPFNVGPDRSKCNADTLHLVAPPGFLNYTWSPSYNIDAVNSQQVIVNPLVDTQYTVMAEKTPGCFAYDTIRVRVFTSPPILLGADTSFCQGDSLVLNPGTGFDQYLWSNGSTGQILVVHNAGSYSVMGTTTEGCKSLDTLRVIQVFSLPAPILDPNPVLCQGTTRILDAGVGYADYLWNNGSTAQAIQVNSTGDYSVQVIDQHGCKGQGATVINRLQPPPASFLGPDTAICSYGSISLRPSQSFNNYLWSTGSTQFAITVTTPGQYWLQVKDIENCQGSDTVLVRPKDCLQGLFVPSAFTPNGDGKNDQLIPLLFGDVKYFRFQLYNRWGELVFQTSTPGTGWDGSYKGRPQDTNVFVWVCRYQFNGANVEERNGKVVLIR